MTLTLLVGGARSGKSTLAVDIGRRHAGEVTFVATAPVPTEYEPDADLRQRIDRHRAERPSHWATIESPLDLGDALDRTPTGLVVIDCLTLWTSNLLLAGRDDDAICDVAATVATAAARRAAPVVAISNEVGLGVHPETDLGRRYRDVHGWVNQAWARAADVTLLLVAGRALRLDDPWSHLPTDVETDAKNGPR